MTIKDIAEKLDYKSLWDGWNDRPVVGGFTSDLLSDVMARAEEGEVLVTIQAHKNTIAVAVLKDLAAIIIASDRPVEDNMLEAAREEGIPLFLSSDDQFTVSWKLHELGGF